jgi:hypothetical protein
LTDADPRARDSLAAVPFCSQPVPRKRRPVRPKSWMHELMTGLLVRTADPDDAPAIRRVARESWSEAYEGIIPGPIQEQAMAAWYSPTAVESSIKSPESILLVGERCQRVVGFVDLASWTIVLRS